jgi:hypothetical protein
VTGILEKVRDIAVRKAYAELWACHTNLHTELTSATSASHLGREAGRSTTSAEAN